MLLLRTKFKQGLFRVSSCCFHIISPDSYLLYMNNLSFFGPRHNEFHLCKLFPFWRLSTRFNTFLFIRNQMFKKRIKQSDVCWYVKDFSKQLRDVQKIVSSSLPCNRLFWILGTKTFINWELENKIKSDLERKLWKMSEVNGNFCNESDVEVLVPFKDQILK